MRITLASLDLFHLGHQARYLQASGALKDFYGSRVRPDHEGIAASRGHSCYPLHYALRVMQRWPHLVGDNHFYLQLCRLFDLWVRSRLDCDTDILVGLSGVTLRSHRAARAAGITTVVDSGSTHPDFQHQILTEEFRRNGFDKALFPEAYRRRLKREFQDADYIQIPSRFVAETHLERGTPAEKLLYATYGVDLDYFTARPSAPADDTFRVICPSGINLRKGARVLVEAWKRLKLRNAELHWIGAPGPMTAHLFKDEFPGLCLHPWLDKASLAALYRRSDVFVLPSFEEGFARVMLEAASSGLPLIATPNTGVENFFTESGKEGWLIPCGDVEMLCEALSAAASDRQETFRRGAAARQRAQGFSWDAYGRQVEANYRAILERKRPSADASNAGRATP